MFLSTLGASLLWNMLKGKDFIWPIKGPTTTNGTPRAVIQAGEAATNPERQGIIKAGEAVTAMIGRGK